MIDRAQKNIRLGGPEAKRRLEILTDCQSLLNEGKPVRSLSYEDPTSAKILRELQFLTSKRVLYVANVGEEDLAGTNPRIEKVQQHAEAEGSEMVKVVARLEAEIAELDEPDRTEMLQSVALKSQHRCFARRASIIGLQSYTAGPKEIRVTALLGHRQQAAGVIHTDFERGFIRAEVYSVDDLVFQSEKAIREAGKMRLRANLVMQDSDVCHFLCHWTHSRSCLDSSINATIMDCR
jgi:ribosome-binding ATPase YchF (GTP1/OBG family)